MATNFQTNNLLSKTQDLSVYGGGMTTTQPTPVTPAAPAPKTQPTPVNAVVQASALNQKTTTVPTPPAPTVTTGNLNMATNTALGGVKTDATPVTPVNKDKEDMKTYLKGIMGNISGQASEEQKIKDELDIQKKKEKATEVSNQIDQMDKAWRDEEKAIRDNAEGKTAQGVAFDVSRAQDIYENKRANIALTYKVLAGDYQGAEEIATEKISSLRAQNQQSLQAYSMFANSVMNDLTESEKLQVQANLTQKANDAKAVQDMYASVLKSAMDNGAPASVLSAIDTASRQEGATAGSVAAAAGQYGGDILGRQYKQAQIDSLNRENGGGLIDSGNDGGYLGIINTILGSGKFTKDQSIAIRNAINSGEDPFLVVKNNAKNIMGQTEATKLSNYEATQFSMQSLKDSINEFYSAGGDTNIFKGNFEKVANRLGEVTDPRLAQLAVEVQSQLQSYRNAISGTAYSDQEGKDIATVFPGINKSRTLNDAIFAGRDKALQASIDGMYKSTLGGAYDKLKSAEKTETKEAPKTKEEDVFDSIIKTSPQQNQGLIPQLWNWLTS